MAKGALRRFCRWCLVAFSLLALTGCDPANAFADLQVKIFLPADGTADIAVEGQLNGVDPTAFVAAIRTELRLGEVDRTTVRLDLGLINGVMDEFGFAPNDGLFVSVCTSARKGTASGINVSTAHWSSCAVWAPENRRSNAAAVITFEDRWPPYATSMIVVALATSIAMAAGIIRAKAKGVDAHDFATVVMCLSVGFLVIAALVIFWSDVRGANDSWWVTGQQIDPTVRDGYVLAAWAALVAAAVVPILSWALKRRHRQT
jgi:hypothetical protein